MVEQFKSRLWVLTAIDLAMGVALFLVSLNLLNSYLEDEKRRTKAKYTTGMLTLVAIFAISFIAEPVGSFSILLRHTEGDTVEEIRMLKTLLKLYKGFTILVIPGIFFFLTFYNLYPLGSSLGFIFFLLKLVIYFHKFGLLSTYAQHHGLTLSYGNQGSGSITPDLPSYGAFGPPSYEEAIKFKANKPRPDENCNPKDEKET